MVDNHRRNLPENSGVKLQLFRLSLMARDQLTLPLGDSSPVSREEYLSAVLSTARPIDRYNKQITYFPGSVSEKILVGYFARQKRETHHDGPETGFSPKDVEYWEKSALVINLEPDQQVVGIEFNAEVGAPKALLYDLVMKINASEDRGSYKIDAFPLHDERNFYQAIAAYPKPITNIEFTYVVPNVFGGAGEVKKALDGFKKGMKARTVKASFANPDGLDTNDETVKESVEYVAKGGGEVKAKSGRKLVYNSENKGEALTASVPEDEADALEKGASPSAKMKAILKR